MTPLFHIESVTKVYNRNEPDEMTALSGVDFCIRAGESIALTGPSGSGKTTLLSLLGCMSRPTSGRIHFDGRNVSALPERFLARTRRESIGFIFQHYHLVRDLSVLDNVMLPLYPSTQSWRQIKQRALDLLERFELSSHKNRRVSLLSGGEQQRVAIARALIGNPDVILADEPTAHLDQALAERLMSFLSDLHGEGKTLVVATHDPFVIQSDLIRRRISLRHGCLVEDSVS